MKRIHLIISGRVQGVGFRYFCQSHAQRLGLTGYVRNREDGSVEVEIEGEDVAVEEFVTLAWNGPRAAHVHDVIREERPVKRESEFRVR